VQSPVTNLATGDSHTKDLTEICDMIDSLHQTKAWHIPSICALGLQYFRKWPTAIDQTTDMTWESGIRSRDSVRRKPVRSHFTALRSRFLGNGTSSSKARCVISERPSRLGRSSDRCKHGLFRLMRSQSCGCEDVCGVDLAAGESASWKRTGAGSFSGSLRP
jgi:hypothetical protein